MKKKRPKASIYRRIWENHYNACILPGMQVHHIDGNPHNNKIENLQVCTPEEHWLIHFNQGDQVALHGKFVANCNSWAKLDEAGKQNRIKLMMDGIRNAWNDPVKRSNMIKQRTGKKRSAQCRSNISIGRGCKPIKVFKKDTGEYVGTWQNASQCARDLGMPKQDSAIKQCLSDKHIRKTHKGYRYEYE